MNTMKHLFFIIVFSIAAILLLPLLGVAMKFTLASHTYVSELLALIFAKGTFGHYLQRVLSLLLMPLIIGGVLAGGFWLLRRKHMPYLWTIVWMIWVILVTALAAKG